MPEQAMQFRVETYLTKHRRIQDFRLQGDMKLMKGGWGMVNYMGNNRSAQTHRRRNSLDGGSKSYNLSIFTVYGDRRYYVGGNSMNKMTLTPPPPPPFRLYAYDTVKCMVQKIG